MGKVWVATGVLVAAVLGLLVMAAATVRSSAFEAWLARFAAQLLTEATGQPSSVKRLQVDLSGVTAQEVRVGVLKVRTVQVHWDPWRFVHGLVRGGDGLDAVRTIVLDAPVISLVRDARGRWNLEEFFRPARAVTVAGPAARPLRAEVRFRRGTVYYLDRQRGGFRAVVSGFGGRLLLADFPLLRAQLSGLVRAGQPARTSASGWIDVEKGILDLRVEVDGLPVHPWGGYLLPNPRWRGLAGLISGRFQLYGNSNQPQVRALVQLAGVRVHLVREGLHVRDVRGPVEVDGPLVRLSGLHARLGGAKLSVRGQIHVAGSGAVALEVEAQDADLALLARLFPVMGVAAEGKLSGQVRVQGPLEAMHVEGTVRTPAVQLQSLRLEDARGKLRYGSGLFSLTDLSTRVTGGVLAGDLLVALSPQPRFLAVGEFLQIPSRVAAAAGLELPLQASLSGAVVAAGTTADPEITGVVKGSAGSVLGHRVEGLESLFSYQRGVLTLRSARAWLGQTSVRAWGRVQGTVLDLDLVARALPVRDVAQAGGLRLEVQGLLDAVGKLGGSTRWPTFAGQVLWKDGRVGPLVFDTARADLVASPNRVEVKNFGVLDGPALYQGSLAWNGEVVRAQVSATGARAERLLGVAGLEIPVVGQVSGELHVDGSLRHPRVTGRGVLLRGQAGGLAVDRAQASFVWTPTQLLLQGLEVQSDALQLRAQGAVDRSGALRLQAEVDPLVLDKLAALQNPYLRLAGSVRLWGEVAGSVHNLQVQAEVDGAHVRVNGQRFDRLSGRVAWAEGALLADLVRLELGQSTYALQGWLRLRPAASADLGLEVRDARLQTLLGMAGVLLDADGRLSGVLRLSGPLSNPRAELDVSFMDGRYQRYPIPSGSGQFVLEDGRVELRQVELVARRGLVRAQGFVNLQGQSEVEVSGFGLEVEALRQALRLRPALSGTVDFTVQFSGTRQDPTVGLALEARDLGVGASGADRVIAQAFYRSGYLELEHVLAEKAGHRLRARGRLPLDPRNFHPDPAKPVELEASTDRADLSLLQILSPRIQKAQGPFEASVRVGGTVATPVLQGFVRAQGGQLELVGVAPVLEGVSLDLDFDQARARLSRFRADVGGGVLEAVGEVTFENLWPQRYAVELSAFGARLEVPPYFRGRVDGRLTLRGTLDRADLSGRLALSAGDLVATTPPPGAGGRPADFPVTLGVDVTAGEGLHVVVGPVRLLVSGAVRLGGTVGQPTLSGRVTGRGGEYRAFGTTFVVEEGSAIFQEFRGTEPVVNARARTRIGDVTVFVHMAGTPQQMQVTLSSQPELPHDRIVQLLVSQAGIQQALTGNVEALLRQQLARFLLGEFEVRLRQLLGIAELRIEYDLERPLRLRLGRFLVENLYLTLTTLFDSQTHFLWALEYRFARHYALAFSQDTLGPWLVLLRANFTW